jgi:hypothetical protein
MAAWFQPATRVAASSSRIVASRARRRRLQAALVILLVLDAVVIFLLFRSPSQPAAARQEELARMEARHDALQAEVEQLRNLRGKVLSATENEQRFTRDNFLPRGSAASQMTQNLNDLATQNRVRPSDISFQFNQGDNQLGWVYVEASLSVQGDYSSLVRFINQLERSQLFWILQGLDVSGGNSPGLRLNLKVATYLTPS